MLIVLEWRGCLISPEDGVVLSNGLWAEPPEVGVAARALGGVACIKVGVVPSGELSLMGLGTNLEGLGLRTTQAEHLTTLSVHTLAGLASLPGLRGGREEACLNLAWKPGGCRFEAPVQGSSTVCLSNIICTSLYSSSCRLSVTHRTGTGFSMGLVNAPRRSWGLSKLSSLLDLGTVNAT